MIPAPRLATVLTCLRRKRGGPLRLLLKEVRQRYSSNSTARKAESVEFKRYALCMIALTLELTPNIPGLKKRCAVRAQLAAKSFPEIMDRLRNRYEELRSNRARQNGSMGDRRETA